MACFGFYSWCFNFIVGAFNDAVDKECMLEKFRVKSRKGANGAMVQWCRGKLLLENFVGDK